MRFKYVQNNLIPYAQISFNFAIHTYSTSDRLQHPTNFHM